jgi:hypothetical protein
MASLPWLIKQICALYLRTIFFLFTQDWLHLIQYTIHVSCLLLDTYLWTFILNCLTTKKWAVLRSQYMPMHSIVLFLALKPHQFTCWSWSRICITICFRFITHNIEVRTGTAFSGPEPHNLIRLHNFLHLHLKKNNIGIEDFYLSIWVTELRPNIFWRLNKPYLWLINLFRLWFLVETTPLSTLQHHLIFKSNETNSLFTVTQPQNYML